MKIVLASASPRRRELLEQIGLPFEVRVSDVEEKAAVLDPGQLVEELSRQKAEAVLAALEEAAEDTIVIGADTVVALEGHILGKPADSEDAAGMLEGLSGKSVHGGDAAVPSGCRRKRRKRDMPQNILREDESLFLLFDKEGDIRLRLLRGMPGQGGSLWDTGRLCQICPGH